MCALFRCSFIYKKSWLRFGPRENWDLSLPARKGVNFYLSGSWAVNEISAAQCKQLSNAPNERRMGEQRSPEDGKWGNELLNVLGIG